jgi:hypothetical protein
MSGKYNLQTFYSCKDWIKLLTVIKIERTNEDGQIICEHCGKAIVNKYDCIGHHMIFLTEDNVNDVEISLNPKLIQLVHHRCHNKIHNKLGYVKKEIFLVYGSPLSGKTSWVKENAEEGDLIISMDNIWECISGQARYIHPGKLNQVAFGVRDYLMDSVKVRRGKWNNAYIIGGFPLISERERIVRELGAREIYIESDKETCLAKADDLKLSEYKKFIEDWWRRFSPKILV